MFSRHQRSGLDETMAWRRFAAVFLRVFVGGAAMVYLLILLIDPYGVVLFSLPLDRAIVSSTQRHMYPQIVRSGRYDSLVIGNSTSRLLDPDLLDKPFGAHFANLAMNAMQAWEQRTMIDLFLRTVGPPKVLIVGLDSAWCLPNADQHRTLYGFPEWMYDDNPWNDYLYLFNTATAEIAGRLVGYQLGLTRARTRLDGYQIITPAETQYDPAKARQGIWLNLEPQALPDIAPPVLSPEERRALPFPALPWLDAILARIPADSLKILAFMPVHVAGQPWPGSRAAAEELECKARIASIARRRGAKLTDWRIPSPITRVDTNYWDRLHYRLPVATLLAGQIIDAALHAKPSSDGSYRLTVP